uniref:Secreted protein n=1 Tax=Macrostomum lignano TaxID=282301 RepID=A0A1I8FPL7_9PLAT
MLKVEPARPWRWRCAAWWASAANPNLLASRRNATAGVTTCSPTDRRQSGFAALAAAY